MDIASFAAESKVFFSNPFKMKNKKCTGTKVVSRDKSKYVFAVGSEDIFGPQIFTMDVERTMFTMDVERTIRRFRANEVTRVSKLI